MIDSPLFGVWFLLVFIVVVFCFVFCRCAWCCQHFMKNVHALKYKLELQAHFYFFIETFFSYIMSRHLTVPKCFVFTPFTFKYIGGVVRPTGSLIAVVLFISLVLTIDSTWCLHAVLERCQFFLIVRLHVFGDVLKILDYHRLFWTTLFVSTHTACSLSCWTRAMMIRRGETWLSVLT